LDAGTFQRQLGDLATTLAFKVQREGIKVLGRSTGIADIYVLVRQAQRTYDLFFYLNADEHRTSPDWRPLYTIVALPSVRSMIDCPYNITVMLDDPKTKPADSVRAAIKWLSKR